MNLEGLEGLGVDFVERADYQELSEFLLERTNATHEPGWGLMSSMGTGSLRFQDWGAISDSNVSDSQVFVLEFPEKAPEMRILLVKIPETSWDDLLPDEDSDTLINLSEAHNKVSEIWESAFSTDYPGILAEYGRNNRGVLSVDSPLTFTSTQILCENLQSAFPIPEGNLSKEDLSDLTNTFRDEDFCSRFRISPNGLMSLDYITESSALLNAESKTSGMGNWIGYSGLSIVEFHDEDKSAPFRFPETEQFEDPFPSLLNYSSTEKIIQLLPYLYYLYWFRVQPDEIHGYSQRLRKMPRSVDEDHLEDYIEILQEAQAGFYDEYIDILDRTDATESLLMGQKEAQMAYAGTGGGTIQFTGSSQELPIPLKQNQSLPNPGYNPEVMGVLPNIKKDTAEMNEAVIKQYGQFEDRYSIAIDLLNQQLDLQISEMNYELAETSVELQEEMKTLTQSSLDLQNGVYWLTIVVTVLTAVLVLEAFGLFTVIADFVIRLIPWMPVF
ncbi:hypothetical protein [Haloferax prahovense]|nr:hypothetical protein [Haloferax prahovense]